MKTILKIFVLGMFVLGFSACSDDILTEKPYGTRMSDSSFSLESDVDGAVHVLYRRVSRATFSTYGSSPAYMGDDLSTHPASNKAAYRDFDLYRVASGNGNINNEWAYRWNIIYAANYIINGVESAPASEEKIKYALNQAHFWRAWAYYNLVRAFGPVPIILSNDVDYTAPVATVAQIYDEVIVPDLQEAENLPDNYTTSPQFLNGVNVVANSAAAKATLAHVYLTMGGWPLQRSECYTKAADKALEVINATNSGTYYYKMYDDYADVFSVAINKVAKNNKEYILGVYYSHAYSDSQTSGYDQEETCRGAIMDLPDCADGWCDYRGEIGFWYTMPDGPRKDVTYPPLTSVANGVAYPWYQDEIPEANRFPYGGKYLETDNGNEYDITRQRGSQFSGWGEKTHPMIRLSEVYLWYAEAVGRSGQTNAKAIELLNTVRNRADGQGASATRADGSANVYSSSMSASQLAEAAYDEHGWEVAMEWANPIASRYYDMQRMDRVKNHFSLRQQNPTYTINGYNVKEPNAPEGSWTESLMFLPYPERDQTLNTNLQITREDKLNLIQ